MGPGKTFFHGINVTLILILLNIGFFILSEIAPSVLRFLPMTPLKVVDQGWWWQLVTYMYVHGGWGHLLMNMLALFIFGSEVEERMGSWEFLVFYHLVGALAGLFSLAFYFVTYNEHIALLGASGAVFGVMLAFASYRPNAVLMIFGVVPMKSTMLVILFTAIAIFSQIFNPNGGVAHMTHLAGFLFAYLYLLLRLRINPWTRFWNPDRYD